MSYVFSKALTKHDEEERLKKQQSLNIPNKIPPPVFSKPAVNKPAQQPPTVKKKPLAKSKSVDIPHSRTGTKSIDLTVVGGSEWKDFVLQRQKERESAEAKQETETNDDGRRSSTSSTTSSCSKDGGDDAQSRRFPSTSSSTSSKDGGEETTGQSQYQRHRTSSTGGKNSLKKSSSIDLAQVGDGEWKRRSSELQEKERADEERQSQESAMETTVESAEESAVMESSVEPAVESVAESAIIAEEPPFQGQNVIDETQETPENVATTNTTELFIVPEEGIMDEKANPGAAPPLTLPKPRKLNAELKRAAFSRSSSSSSSKSFSTGETAPVIKRSSDLLKETLSAPRNNRSLSFDTQTPYFCRQSRQLTLDLEETLAQCEQELNESLVARKASEGEHKDINEIERSPDVVAMKNEIAIERSKIGSERQKLSDTIDEIENMDFDFNALVKPACEEEDVFVPAETTQISDAISSEGQASGVSLPTQTLSSNDSLQETVDKTENESTEGEIKTSELKPSDETSAQEQAVKQNDDEPCDGHPNVQTNETSVDQSSSDQLPEEPAAVSVPAPCIETGSNDNLQSSIETKDDGSTSVVLHAEVDPISCVDSTTTSETTVEVSLLTQTVEQNQQDAAIGTLDIKSEGSSDDSVSVVNNADTLSTTPSAETCSTPSVNDSIENSSLEATEVKSITIAEDTNAGSIECSEASVPQIETDPTLVDKNSVSTNDVALNQSEITVDHSTTETNCNTVLVTESTALGDPDNVKTANQCEPVIAKIKSVDTNIEISVDKKEGGDTEISTNENISLGEQSNTTLESESIQSEEINGTVKVTEVTNGQISDAIKPDVSNKEVSNSSPEVTDESSKSCNGTVDVSETIQVNGDVPSNVSSHIAENGFTEKVVFV